VSTHEEHLLLVFAKQVLQLGSQVSQLLNKALLK